jgi:hypothetical protein
VSDASGTPASNGAPDEARQAAEAEPVVRSTFRFAIVPEALIFDPELNATAVRVYAGLARYVDVAGKAWPGLETLAERIGCNEKTIRRAVTDLKRAKWLEVKRRGLGLPNLYVLHPEGPVWIGRECPAGSDEYAHSGPGVSAHRTRAIERDQGNEKLAKAPRARTPRDDLFDVVAEWLGIPKGSPIGKRAAMIGKCLTELLRIETEARLGRELVKGEDPDVADLSVTKLRYGLRFYPVEWTRGENGLIKHWPLMRQGRRPDRPGEGQSLADRMATGETGWDGMMREVPELGAPGAEGGEDGVQASGR